MSSILSNQNFKAGYGFGKRLAASDPALARHIALRYECGDLAPANDIEEDVDFGIFCGVIHTIEIREKKRSAPVSKSRSTRVSRA